MKGLNLPKIGLALPDITKFYIASSERKIWQNQSLINFLFARNLIYVHQLDYLNMDAAIATVHYGEGSALHIFEKEMLPFKFERIFKSYHGRHKPVPLSFMGNTAINLVRILRETGKKHVVRVDSDKKEYFNQFTEVCFKELDSDSVGYANLDFSPAGDITFTIRHFDHQDGSYSIVTWISGNWS